MTLVPPRRDLLSLPRLAVVLVASLWTLESCDLGARDPHPPEGRDSTLVSLTDPDSTIRQLEVGFESGVITSYLNAYADDFVFHPDPVDSSEAFDNPWGIATERQTTSFIFSRFRHRQVAFADGGESTGVGDIVVFKKDYALQVDTTQVDTTTHEGQAELHLRQDSGEWRIIFWQDNRLQGSSLPTWGILRGQNAPGARVPPPAPPSQR